MTSHGPIVRNSTSAIHCFIFVFAPVRQGKNRTHVEDIRRKMHGFQPGADTVFVYGSKKEQINSSYMLYMCRVQFCTNP